MQITNDYFGLTENPLGFLAYGKCLNNIWGYSKKSCSKKINCQQTYPAAVSIPKYPLVT